MAKKKRRTDNTLLTSIYSPEYQYLAQQNSPVNSNVFYTGGGLYGNGNGGTDWASMGQQDNGISVSNLGLTNPYSGMNQQNIGTPTGSYTDGLQTEYHRVNPIKYLSMSEPERMRQNELRQEAREARKAEDAQNPSNNVGGVNWGGVIGAAATNVANSITDPNATTAQKVANALGAPEMAKIWSADWDKANAQLKGIQENIAAFNNKNYIQDSNDIQGAGAGLKLNNKPLTLLNTNPQKNLTWKDFRGNMFLKGAKATLQGAASGSVGGPWGALGGAVVGALGSLFGGINARTRAKKAKREYDRMLADYNTYGLQQNAKAIMERDLSNKNLLSNGLKQQNISEMANFRAYGGNLYPIGGTIREGNEEAQESVYEGGELPEITVSAESMPWYEKIWNTYKRNIINPLIQLPRRLTSIEAQYANSYDSDNYTFNEAYADARSKGQKTFFWNNNYYNTDYEGTHGEQYKQDVASGKAANWEQIYPNYTNPELRKEKQEELNTYGITNEQTRNKTPLDYLLRKIPASGYNVNDAISGIKDEFTVRKNYDSPEALISALERKYPDLKNTSIPIKDSGRIGDVVRPESMSDEDWELFKDDVMNWNMYRSNNYNPELHKGEYDYLLGFPNKTNNGYADNLKISSYKTGKLPYYYTSSRLEESEPFIGESGLFDEYTQEFDNTKKRIEELESKLSYPNREEWLRKKQNGVIDEDRADADARDAQINKKYNTELNKLYDNIYAKQNDFINRYYDDDKFREYWENNGVFINEGDLDYIDWGKVKKLPKKDLKLLGSIGYLSDTPKFPTLTQGNYLAKSSPTDYYQEEDDGGVYGKGKYTNYINFIKNITGKKPDSNKYNSSNINLEPFVNAGHLGTYTLGIPKNNQYISIYDKFDINPFGSGNDKPIIEIGSPFEYYTRFYRNEEPDIDRLYENLDNTKAMGGNLYTDLSPNMMSLWNNKQNIDKQKIMNQQMNFGLGNSFNQKLNTFDYGGAMNGMDLPTDMQYYENGGTHEENPNGGIQVGQDQQGNPNLVEEGEFRYGDYIFSDRIPVDYSILSDFNAGKSKGSRNTKNNPTYAELAKKTADKYKDLNDEISKNSLNKQLERLQQSQEAQKFKEQQDQQYADYTNALKNPTQGNPMYGSMKYSGMGNTNQGVNAGTDEGMGNPMDNSDLSNVNRSGNPMMAAYGGNIFSNGGRPVLHGKIFPTRINPYGDSQLGIIDSNNDINGYGLPIRGTQYLTYTGLVDYPTRDNNEPSIYNLNSPKTQNLGDASAYGYNTATKDDYNKLNIDVPFNPSGMVGNVGYSQLPFNRPELAGVNTNFNPIINPTTAQKQQLLVNNGYNLGSTGFYNNGVDNVWGKKSQEAWNDFTGNKYGSTQGNQNQTSPNSSKYNYQSGSYKVKESGANQEGLDKYNNEYKPSDGIGVTSEQNGNNFTSPQKPQESRGDVDLKNAEVVSSTPYNRPMYDDSGIWTNLGKGIAPNLMNWANRANWEFDPDWKPEAKLEALGKTAYRERIADHLGDYISPNLMDVERLNNAAMAQTAANARGINNIGGGNRGFAGAQMAANDYNSQMGIGNNYVTTNQYNADQKQRAAEFNRATNEFNATANNEAWRDNLNSWLQGKNMEINALVQANQARNQKAEYKDRVDREAALNRSSDLGVMTDNMINTVVDEARFNRDLNIANQDRSNRYWYDKKKGSMYDAANTDYENSMRDLMNGKYVDSEAWNQLNALNKEYGFDTRANKDKLRAAENIINQSQERYNNKQDLLKKEKAETLKNDYNYALNNYNVMRNDPEFMKYMGKALNQGKLGTFSDLYGSDISEQELRRYMDDVNRLYSYYNSYGNRPSENTAKAYGGKLKTRKKDYSLSLS